MTTLLLLAACGSTESDAPAGVGPRADLPRLFRSFLDSDVGFIVPAALPDARMELDPDGALLRHGEEAIRFRAATFTVPTRADRTEVGLAEPGEALVWDHPNVREWWTAADGGMEHGFVVASGPVDIAVRIEGADAQVDPDAHGATLVTPAGWEVRYDRLAAWDADGRDLPARMVDSDEGVRLQVDTTGARYPIVVDPFTSSLALDNAGPGDFTGAGDINGDGYADIAAHYPPTGTVFVYMGGPAMDGYASYALSYNFGPSARLDAAGDTNGDGYDDLVVTNPAYSAGKGVIRTFHGHAYGLSWTYDRQIVGAFTTTALGTEIAGIGDIDADGYDDIAASTASGQVRIYRGSSVGTRTTSPQLLSPADHTPTGETLAGGDVNGDGYDDLVVGTYTADSYAGSFLVYDGTALGLDTTATEVTYPYYGYYSYYCNDYPRMGYAVDVLPDANGDGYAEVVASAPTDICDGFVYLYYGSAAGVDDSQWTEWWGYTGLYQIGWTMAHGDFDGDGDSDIAFGGGDAGYALSAGGWDLSDGTTEVTLTPTEISGTAATYDYTDVDTLGDVDGDGCDDLAVNVSSSSTAATLTVYYGYGSGCYAIAEEEADVEASPM